MRLTAEAPFIKNRDSRALFLGPLLLLLINDMSHAVDEEGAKPLSHIGGPLDAEAKHCVRRKLEVTGLNCEEGESFLSYGTRRAPTEAG